MSQIKVVVSLVSHDSQEYLYKYFRQLPSSCNVVSWLFVLRDNIGNPELESWCDTNGIEYVRNSVQLGYGANHNENFIMFGGSSDFFLILNPDVSVDFDTVRNHLKLHSSANWALRGARVFEPENPTASQKRQFPNVLGTIFSFISGRKMFALNPKDSGYTDWIGGSFMLWNSKAFEEIGGFSPDFFMYFEDIDICRRLKKNSMEVYYDSNMTFLHEAQRDGRRLFSKHFWFALKSYITYIKKYGVW